MFSRCRDGLRTTVVLASCNATGFGPWSSKQCLITSQSASIAFSHSCGTSTCFQGPQCSRHGTLLPLPRNLGSATVTPPDTVPNRLKPARVYARKALAVHQPRGTELLSHHTQQQQDSRHMIKPLLVTVRHQTGAICPQPIPSQTRTP